MRSNPFIPAALTFGSCLWPMAVEAAFPQLKLEVVCANQINSPVAMVSAGDGTGRMFVCDQRGQIRIFRNGMLEPGVFLDVGPKLVSERSGFDERGLLGMAFHPGFANAQSPGFRKFYLFYNSPSPNAPGTTIAPVDNREVIAEYQVTAGNPDLADLTSERILLSFDKPQFNHNGGGLEFGPDGMLYFSVGDGGGSNDNQAGHTGGSATNPRPTNNLGNAQDLTRWSGKLHRIDPLGTNGSTGQYGIPIDNPFASTGGGVRPEIYAYGLRNPWRFCFDNRPGGSNQLFCADVGQGQVEEIDLILPGSNYGWRNKEGTFSPAFSVGAPALTGTVRDPLVQYAHPGVTIGTPPLPQYGTSVTGGYVYRGSAIPGLVGKYLFADWSQSFSIPTGRLLGMEEASPAVFTLTNLDVLGGNPVPYFIQGFGQDDAGELYILARKTLPVSAPNPATGLPSGSILKILPVPATTSVNLSVSKDNTIYQESDNSNGMGNFLFAGAVDNVNGKNGDIRRSLLAFNLSPIPAGASVASASLTLKMDRTTAPAYPFSLHKLLADWGEGTANADVQEGDGAPASATDATWGKPFFGQPATWTEPGGDFSETKSATTTVNSLANYTWTAPQLAYDVNAWLAASATNHGWLLKGDVESSVKPATGTAGQLTIIVSPDTDGLVDGMPVKGTGIGAGALIAAGGINTATNTVTLTIANSGAVAGDAFFAVPSAKRFASQQANTASFRPKLAVSYIPAPAAPSHRKAWENQYFFIGEYINDNRDTDNDGLADGIEYAWGFSPKSRNSLSDGLTVDYSGLASGNPIIATFRRDPLATDVTYELQMSSDMTTWTTLCQSIGGATPTGSGFVSESVISGQSPYRNVVVSDVTPVATKRFVRLKVKR